MFKLSHLLHLDVTELWLQSAELVKETRLGSRGNLCFAGLLTLGGSTVASYAPDTGLRETLTENKSAAILKLR